MTGNKIMNYKHITTNERCCIANFLSLGLSLRKIAKHLNRNISTISREVKRNSTNGKYLAHIACENYGKNKKSLVLDLDNTLWGGIVGDDGQ